jgi:ATP-dependent RNA helicase DeaD
MEMTGATKSQVSRIDIKGVYSFIEMEPAVLPKAMESFKGEIFNGRKVRVEISGNGTPERKSFSGKKTKEKRGWGEKPSYQKKEGYGGDKKRKRSGKEAGRW